MLTDTPISLRLTPDLVERAEALVTPMGNDTSLVTITGGRVKRSTVLRLAVLRGIEVLEQQYTTSPEAPEKPSDG